MQARSQFIFLSLVIGLTLYFGYKTYKAAEAVGTHIETIYEEVD